MKLVSTLHSGSKFVGFSAVMNAGFQDVSMEADLWLKKWIVFCVNIYNVYMRRQYSEQFTENLSLDILSLSHVRLLPTHCWGRKYSWKCGSNTKNQVQINAKFIYQLAKWHMTPTTIILIRDESGACQNCTAWYYQDIDIDIKYQGLSCSRHI